MRSSSSEPDRQVSNGRKNKRNRRHPSINSRNGYCQSLISLLRQRFSGRSDAYLSEKRKRVIGRLTDDVLTLHLEGKDRVAIYPGDIPSYIAWDFDGKNPRDKPLGRSATLEQLQEVNNTVVGLGLPPVIAEESRGGKGFHALQFFDTRDPLTFELARKYGKIVLRAAGLQDDENEDLGHPGVYPKGPGPKGYGTPIYLPLWNVLGRGTHKSRLVDVVTGDSLSRQLDVFENVQTITASQIKEAIRTLEEIASDDLSLTERAATPAPETSVSIPESPKRGQRHNTLAKVAMSLRNKLSIEDATSAAMPLAKKWGMLAEGRKKEVGRIVRSAYRKPSLDGARDGWSRLDLNSLDDEQQLS